MPRPQKVAVVDEVREELASNPATLLTEYRGLSVGAMADLRRQLRASGARYVVVKNTLARIAARDAGFEDLEELLTGPTALTYCHEDPVGPAKALRQFARDHPGLVVKGGVLDGRVVDAGTAAGLADLESREELLAKLARLMYGALAGAASLFQAPLSAMARLVAALEERGEVSSAEPGEPQAASEDADAAPGEPDAEEPGAVPDEPEVSTDDEAVASAEDDETTEAGTEETTEPGTTDQT